jgi:hypothetical protein
MLRLCHGAAKCSALESTDLFGLYGVWNTLTHLYPGFGKVFPHSNHTVMQYTTIPKTMRRIACWTQIIIAHCS